MKPIIIFLSFISFLSTASASNYILTQQTINITFKVNNTQGRQVIFDGGGTRRGMNIYLDNNRLYCGFYNISDDGDGAQPYTFVSTTINKDTVYQLSWIYDYANYTGPNGPDGTLQCIINENTIGFSSTTSRLYWDFEKDIIGYKENGTYYHDGPSLGLGDYFNGQIFKFEIN